MVSPILKGLSIKITEAMKFFTVSCTANANAKPPTDKPAIMVAIIFTSNVLRI